MGCDIHMYQEVKINGKWECAGAPPMTRWYQMFGKMAGVRSADEKPIIEPKGLPDDLSAYVRLCADYGGTDGHTRSWFNAEEIAQYIEWLEANPPTKDYWYPEKLTGYIMGTGWDSFHKYPEDRISGIEDVRFVFWFDN